MNEAKTTSTLHDSILGFYLFKKYLHYFFHVVSSVLWIVKEGGKKEGEKEIKKEGRAGEKTEKREGRRREGETERKGGKDKEKKKEEGEEKGNMEERLEREGSYKRQVCSLGDRVIRLLFWYMTIVF